jgi:hypothetical protein
VLKVLAFIGAGVLYLLAEVFGDLIRCMNGVVRLRKRPG